MKSNYINLYGYFLNENLTIETEVPLCFGVTILLGMSNLNAIDGCLWLHDVIPPGYLIGGSDKGISVGDLGC